MRQASLLLPLLLSGCFIHFDAHRHGEDTGIPANALRLSIPAEQLKLCDPLPKLDVAMGDEATMLKSLDSWITVNEKCAGGKKVLVDTLRAADVKPIE